jgi:4-aminobutyrate aminotransferase/(S)-3-amino-2-methylpropionate transaminase
VPAPGFLKGVQDFAREHGFVFIADEIQTGFARTGDLFASEHEGIVPDLICTAKALGGGLPLSAVTGRRELMDAVGPGTIGGTYAGNPVACASALAAIGIIERDDLAGRARAIEAHVVPRLRAVAEDVPAVGEVRGRGAMLAMEFVVPGTKQPDPVAARAVAAHCLAQGVLILTCGTFGNVIRLLPPLVIEPDLLDDALDVIEEALRTLAP